MSADIQPLTPASGAADRQVPGATGGGSVYLDAYLAPFRQWLDRDTVTEIIVNRPGEVWIEDAAIPGGMQRIETDAITDMLVQRLAEQVARVSHQGINREHPRDAARWRARAVLRTARSPQALGDGDPAPPASGPAARCLRHRPAQAAGKGRDA